MYTIRMKNCAFFARRGVLDEEETLGQRFYVDAVLDVVPDSALESDSIDATVDYGVAFIEIEKIITGKRRFLIEALALDVARGLAHCSSLDPIVIHRDVKGANCLVTSDYSAKVADFGAAKRKGQDGTQTMVRTGYPGNIFVSACGNCL